MCPLASIPYCKKMTFIHALISDNNSEGVISAASLLRSQSTSRGSNGEDNGPSGIMKATLRKKGPERII